MKPHKPLALGAALALLAPGLSAQTPPPEPPQTADAPPAPDAEDAVPAPLYSRYYVPFLDSIWSRLHNTQPFLRTDPLFPRYDTASGLERPTQTSRVASRGFRAEVYAPIIEAKVGDIVEVPISIRNSPPWTAVRTVLAYNTAVLSPIGLKGVGTPSEVLTYNASPDPEQVRYAERSVVALVIATTPGPKAGPVMSLTFRALRVGESPLEASLSEIADSRFDQVPNIFYSGLVRVLPRQ